MEGRILAVDDDAMNRKLVSATMARAGYEVITANNGREAVQVAEAVLPDLIIMDVMMPEMDGFEACKRLRSQAATARIPVIMLTALDTVDEKLKGFEAGADDYLPKPFAPDELQARVRVLLRRSTYGPKEAASQTGKIIGVFSLRGGMGVSTLAANLATGLAQLWRRPAVLVDLALAAGQSALMLNLPYRNTWADLAQVPDAEVDTALVNDVLLPHHSGAFVLAASPRPEQNEYLTGSKVGRVLDLLRQQYDYLVLDLPHDFRETTLAGLDAANEIVAMLSPELASVRAMVVALEVFDSLGYPAEKIRLVMNWTFQRQGLARKDIEAALKRPIDLVIPFAGDELINAINLGAPPVIAGPGSNLGALFEDMAFFFSDEQQRRKKPQNPSDAWQRVAQRLKQRQRKR